MNYKVKILIAAAALASAVSCAKSQDSLNEAAVDLTTESMAFTRSGVCEGGSAVSTVNCNYDWVAYPTAPWITVNPTSGEAGKDVNVTISVGENRVADGRIGEVNFFDVNMLSKRSCTVSQEGAYFSIDEEEKNFNLLYDATQIEFTIRTNAKWSLTSSNPDYVPSVTSGEGETTVKVTFPTNMGEEVNNVDIVVTADLDIEKNVETVKIIQKCFEYYVVISEPASPDYFETSVVIAVDANTSWTAKAITPGVTVSPSSGTTSGNVTVTIPANAKNAVAEYKVEILADKSTIEQRGGEVVISQKPAVWVPFGKVWGKDLLTQFTELFKTQKINTYDGISIASWPSNTINTTQFRGNMEFFFYAGEGGDATVTVYGYYNSTSTTKKLTIMVNDVSVFTTTSTNTATKVVCPLGVIKAGDKISINTAGSGNNFLKIDADGNWMSFEKK